MAMPALRWKPGHQVFAMSMKLPLPERHAFDTQPQAQSSLKENCQLDKGSHKYPPHPLELSTQSHLQPILG